MQKVIKTRVTKDGDAHETNLTVDFADVTQEQLEELASRSIIITTQARYRIAGTVPKDDVVNVAELLKRERAPAKQTPESLAAKILKLPAEERAAVMRMFEAEMKATGKKAKKAEPAEAV